MKNWQTNSLFFSLVIAFNIILTENAAAQDVGFPGNPLSILFIFILIIAFVILILFIQVQLSKNAGPLKLILVWGIYPLLMIISIGLREYKINTSAEFAGRDFKIQTSEITSILFSNPAGLGFGGHMSAPFLRFNKKNRIAFKDTLADKDFEIYYLAPLKDCKNSEEKGAPKISSQHSRSLLRNGYFNECIMRQKSSNFEYDLRIEKGKHLKRFLEPCCNTAEFYVSKNGKDEFIGRWEAITRGRGKKNPNSGADWDYFDVLSNLSGIQYPKELLPNKFSDLNTELLRIENALTTDNIYYKENEDYIVVWLKNQVLGWQYSREHTLSEAEYKSLTKILLLVGSYNRTQIARGVGTRLNSTDTKRLIKWKEDTFK